MIVLLVEEFDDALVLNFEWPKLDRSAPLLEELFKLEDPPEPDPL